MAAIAGLQDSRKEGSPADIGTYQFPCNVLVFQHTFSGVTYICAIRHGDRGWVLVSHGVDEATVIQAALNALDPERFATGGESGWDESVYVLPGRLVYTINTTIIVPEHAILDGCGSYFKLADGANCNIIDVGDGVTYWNYATVRNLYLDGNKANNLATGNGLRLHYTVKATVENVKVHDCRENGIYQQGEAAGKNCSENILMNNRVYDCELSGFKTVLAYTGTWFNNYAQGNTLYGFELWSGLQYMSHSHAYDNYYGLYIASSGSHFVNFYADANKRHGVYFTNVGNFNTFEGLTLYANGQDAAGTYSGVYCLGTSNSIINIFDDDNGAPPQQLWIIQESGGANYNFFQLAQVRKLVLTTGISLLVGLQSRIRDVPAGYSNAALLKTVTADVAWGVAPTNLEHCTDGDWDTPTGTGTTILGGAGTIGRLNMDLLEVRNVLVRFKVGLWSSAGTITVFIAYSNDGVTYYNASGSLCTSVTVAAEEIKFNQVEFVRARYIRLSFLLSAAATANVKIYEWEAIALGM